MLEAEKILKRLKSGSLGEAFKRFNEDVLQSKPAEKSSPYQPTPEEVKDDRSFREDMMKDPAKQRT